MSTDGDAGEQPGVGERTGDDPVGAHPHQPGGVEVLCRASNGEPEHRPAEHPHRAGQHEHGDQDRHQVHHLEADAAELDRVERVRRLRELPNLRRHADLPHRVRERLDRERCEEQRERAGAADPPERHPFGTHRRQHCGGDHHRDRSPPADAPRRQEVGRVGRHREELAVGEVDEVHDAEHERDAEREQRVGAAAAEPVDDVLDQFTHASASGAVIAPMNVSKRSSRLARSAPRPSPTTRPVRRT